MSAAQGLAEKAAKRVKPPRPPQFDAHSRAQVHASLDLLLVQVNLNALYMPHITRGAVRAHSSKTADLAELVEYYEATDRVTKGQDS